MSICGTKKSDCVEKSQSKRYTIFNVDVVQLYNVRRY